MPGGYGNIKPSDGKATQFKKGQSGNPKGRPALPNIDEAMQSVLGEEKDGKTALDAILAALRAKAAKGDIRAAEVLLNRGYGLPKQTVKHQGDENEPIVFKTDERFLNNNAG